ncbi:MAG: hypothetical protein ACKO9H_04205, partial [Planctomycetota bacterium]
LLTVAIENSDAAARKAAKDQAKAAVGAASDEAAKADQTAGEAAQAPAEIRTLKTRLEELSFERKWEHRIEEKLKAEHQDWTEKQIADEAKSQLTPQFNLLGVACFAFMALVLFLISLRK